MYYTIESRFHTFKCFVLILATTDTEVVCFDCCICKCIDFIYLIVSERTGSVVASAQSGAQIVAEG